MWASLGLLERGFFVHSCAVRVYLTAAKDRVQIPLVFADRCRCVRRPGALQQERALDPHRCVVWASLGLLERGFLCILVHPEPT